MKYTTALFFSILAAAAADPFQGDWQGRYNAGDNQASLAAQVVAEGEGNYRVNLMHSFDQGEKPLAVLQGTAGDGRLTAQGGETTTWTITFEGTRAVGTRSGAEDNKVSLEKTVRLSPKLGLKPPAGAQVLLGGDAGLGAWRAETAGEPVPAAWKTLPHGVIEVTPGTPSICTRDAFRDFQLHLEFKTPLMAAARGQGRANSGVYIYSRYEVQILDSYGLEPLLDGCGALYRKVPPRVNMCAPPEQWQSYDITFTAPRFDAEGKKTSNARVTLVHNGVTVHDDVELQKGTGQGGSNPEVPRGWIKLQDHRDKIQFRNIWIEAL